MIGQANNNLIGVIVVDNRPQEHDEIRDVLIKWGYSPHFCSDIKSAFDSFKELVADRLLVNYQLGTKKRGRVLLEWIDDSPMRIPTVVMNCSPKDRSEVDIYTVRLDFVRHVFEVKDLHLQKIKMQEAFKTNDAGKRPVILRPGERPKVFVIHGHDVSATENGLENSLRRIVHILNVNLSMDAIVVRGEPINGGTIINKIEEVGRGTSFAVALFTADDVGKLRTDSQAPLAFRARQNVVFEAGFVRGYLDPERTVIIVEDGLELPSDLGGIRTLTLKKDDNEIILALKQMFDLLKIDAPIKLS